MSKPIQFKTRKDAQAAADECANRGWLAGVRGTEAPFYVDAIGYANGRRVLIRYDLHEDGEMREYSRKELVP